MPDDDRYSLTELSDLAGVTPRTVRYYLAQGLLPAVGQPGPGSKYDAGHLARLRVIRRLQNEHLPLAEIRRRLERLGEDDIRDLAATAVPPPPADSALDYLRSVLAPRRPGSVAESAPAYRSMPGASDAVVRVTPSPPTLRDAPARPLERSQWDRIVLAPDVELHVRRPLSRALNRGVDRLVTIARELLEEDRP